jgi:hypothetical protein
MGKIETTLIMELLFNKMPTMHIQSLMQVIQGLNDNIPTEHGWGIELFIQDNEWMARIQPHNIPRIIAEGRKHLIETNDLVTLKEWAIMKILESTPPNTQPYIHILPKDDKD